MASANNLPTGLITTPLEGFVPSEISGNANPETKDLVAKWLHVLARRGTSHGPKFADRVGKRLELKEVSIQQKAEEPTRFESRVVIQSNVQDDMLNAVGKLHGGCSAYLVDTCSALAMSAMSFANKGSGIPANFQSVNLVFHAPASPGDELKIINTSLTIGGRAMSARTEIWDTTNHRLVLSATQVNMQTTAPSKL